MKIRDVEIRFVGEQRDELHVERADGTVSVVLTPDEALELVSRDDRVIAKKSRTGVVTRITWSNTPAGFSGAQERK